MTQLPAETSELTSLEKLLIKYKNEQNTNNTEQAILYGIPIAKLLKITKLYLKDWDVFQGCYTWK